MRASSFSIVIGRRSEMRGRKRQELDKARAKGNGTAMGQGTVSAGEESLESLTNRCRSGEYEDEQELEYQS